MSESNNNPEPIDCLIDETVKLFHRLKVVAEELHGGDEMAAGKRGILKELQSSGPQTVPNMARARPVSRQHIQSLVNPLAEEGLVELIENPHHKRSKLVQLTPAGTQVVEAMNRRERIVLTAIQSRLDTEAMNSAADALQRLRTVFETNDWNRAVESARRARKRSPKLSGTQQ